MAAVAILHADRDDTLLGQPPFTGAKYRLLSSGRKTDPPDRRHTAPDQGTVNAEALCRVREVVSEEKFRLLWAYHAENPTLEELRAGLRIRTKEAVRQRVE